MSNTLPARPNLEHLRGQAKALLASFRSADASAVDEFRAHLPSLVGLSAERAAGQALTLSDAQSAVARKHGFDSWQKLMRYVEALNAIDGSWSFTSMVIEGQAMPEAAYGWARLIIDGKNFKMTSAGDVYEGHCDIDVEATPNRIDIHFTDGPEKGNDSLGIFDCDGRDLKICLGFTNIPRPTEFASVPGSGVALETLRRAGGEAEPKEPYTPEPTLQPTPEMLLGFGEVSPEMEKLQGDGSQCR